MNVETVRRMLAHRAEQLGSHQRLADEIGVSRALVSLVLQGHRAPTEKFLLFLGLERVRFPPTYRVRNGNEVATIAWSKREGRNHAKSPRSQQPVD